MFRMTTMPWGEIQMNATELEYGEDENHNSHVTAAWIGDRKFEPRGPGSVFTEVTDNE